MNPHPIICTEAGAHFPHQASRFPVLRGAAPGPAAQRRAAGPNAPPAQCVGIIPGPLSATLPLAHSLACGALSPRAAKPPNKLDNCSYRTPTFSATKHGGASEGTCTSHTQPLRGAAPAYPEPRAPLSSCKTNRPPCGLLEISARARLDLHTCAAAAPAANERARLPRTLALARLIREAPTESLLAKMPTRCFAAAEFESTAV